MGCHIIPLKSGDSFSAVQATIIVELSNPLGLNLAVVVKAVNYESAQAKDRRNKNAGIEVCVKNDQLLGLWGH
jgi:hypothetical protein